MMKSVIFLFILLSAYPVVYAQSIEGNWATGQDNTIIQIRLTDDQLHGVIKSSDNIKAPLGKVIIKDLQKDGDQYKGKLFVLKKSKWVDAFFKCVDKHLQIEVSAGFRKKRIEWNLSK